MSAPREPVFPRIKLAVSACLVGERVRYDGGHKRHAFLGDILAAHADYLPICPEAGIGMGVPRPPIHLVGERQQPHALGLQDPTRDVTAQLQQFGARTLGSLDGLSGYIFKKNSPSCGLRQVKVFARPGRYPQRNGTGIFARVIRESLPLLPVEEEDALDNPQRRDNFLCRVYVYRRWQDLQARGLCSAGLGAFHAVHESLVMAHSRAAFGRLEKLLSTATEPTLAETAAQYIQALMTTLARPARRSQHCTVLAQLAGELKPLLTPRQSALLAGTLAAYLAGNLALTEAIDTLRSHVDRHAQLGLGRQAYLYPYPDSLRPSNY